MSTSSPDTKFSKNKPNYSKFTQFAKSFISYLVIFVVIYSLVNWWRQPVMPSAPTLQFHSVQGHSIDVNRLSTQKPVLIYFWGTWCSVCRRTSPSVQKIANNHNYPVIGVAVSSGENQDILQYMHKKDLDFITVNDDSGNIFRQWQGQVTPSYVILKNGKAVQSFTGIQPGWLLNLRLKIASF
ncbi:putative thioredoxin protein [Moraxella macacae 0408225]|uniref:Putative thioredoxin protein n=1 Tax=Moraxella macacae 0408225 TaxID=1230338 RepID=L2F8A1_9GAMM|nr:protein disulfide oxidoreductase [Moraxella macacae]ELA09110.1 putative thioredoxin protein [Moraxella macacae 0408225]